MKNIRQTRTTPLIRKCVSIKELRLCVIVGMPTKAGIQEKPGISKSLIPSSNPDNSSDNKSSNDFIWLSLSCRGVIQTTISLTSSNIQTHADFHTCKTKILYMVEIPLIV